MNGIFNDGNQIAQVLRQIGLLFASPPPQVEWLPNFTLYIHAFTALVFGRAGLHNPVLQWIIEAILHRRERQSASLPVPAPAPQQADFNQQQDPPQQPALLGQPDAAQQPTQIASNSTQHGKAADQGLQDRSRVRGLVQDLVMNPDLLGLSQFITCFLLFVTLLGGACRLLLYLLRSFLGTALRFIYNSIPHAWMFARQCLCEAADWMACNICK